MINAGERSIQGIPFVSDMIGSSTILLCPFHYQSAPLPISAFRRRKSYPCVVPGRALALVLAGALEVKLEDLKRGKMREGEGGLMDETGGAVEGGVCLLYGR